VTENGKVSLTRTLDGIEPERLQTELPQIALSAELQGIKASFPNVLLDESCYSLRDTVQGILSSPTELVGMETPPASVKLNLLPESWRLRRTQLAKRGEWQKRLILAGAAYAGLFLLFLLYLGYSRFAIARLDRLITRAPAIDSHYYPVEILFRLSQDLPSPEIHITAYNQSARQISVDGEANTATLAYQFAEKVKKDGALQNFRFDMAAPRILPNNHAQFRLEGKPR
jgi:hypothetical protein